MRQTGREFPTPPNREQVMQESSARNRDTDSRAEVAEFILNGQSFGINGSKIKEIVLYDEDKVTEPPFNHPSVVGVYLYRGQTVPLIDLKAYLGLPLGEDVERSVVVVTEFNEMASAFITDRVNRIHRLKWSDLKPMDPFLVKFSPRCWARSRWRTGRCWFWIWSRSSASCSPRAWSTTPSKNSRTGLSWRKGPGPPCFFAEDSFVIRSQLQKVLKTLGYSKVQSFEHGKAALEAIRALKEKAEQEQKPLTDFLDLLISDIEMPQLDGLTLCRTLKLEMGIKVPVILFSSLINEQVARKCRDAGADDFVSKPQTEVLIEKMDSFCLK